MSSGEFGMQDIIILMMMMMTSMTIRLHKRAFYLQSYMNRPPRWPSGKAFASRAEDPGFESGRDFFGVESYQ